MAQSKKVGKMRISPMAGKTTWAQLFEEAERRAKAHNLKTRDTITDLINRLMPPPAPKSFMASPRAGYWDARRQVETSVRWSPGTMNMTLDITIGTSAGALVNSVRALDFALRKRMTSIGREWDRHMMPVTLERMFIGVWSGEWRFLPASEAVRRRYWNTSIWDTVRELELEVVFPELYESLVVPSQFVLDTFHELGCEGAKTVQEAVTTMAKASWANARAVCVDSERLQRMVDSSALMPPRDEILEEEYPKESDYPDIELALRTRLKPLVEEWQDINDFFDVSDTNAESELVQTVAQLLVCENEFRTSRANRIQDIYLAILFHTVCPLADNLEYVIFDTRQILRAAFGELPSWFRPEASLCPSGCHTNEELHQRLAAARQFYFENKENLAVKPDLAVVVSRPSQECRTGGTWLHWDVGDECTVPLTGPVRAPEEVWQPCPDEEMTIP